jgi:hypothetical protein
MPHSVAPFTFQNINNELKACLIKYFFSPSQMLQPAINEVGSKETAIYYNVKYISNDSWNARMGNTPFSQPEHEDFQGGCHFGGLHSPQTAEMQGPGIHVKMDAR